MTAKIRVLIADDHMLARTGTRALLASANDVEIVAEASDGDEAILAARKHRPDVILMDLVMPGTDGVEAIQTILKEQRSARIVILTGSGIDAKILDAVRVGALGYVDKATDSETLVESVRRAARGEHSIPLSLTRKLMGQIRFPTQIISDPLTQRESEIATLVARGLSNQQIADQLFISEGTVRTHMSRVLSKLGYSNRVEVALYALRSGLASLETGTADFKTKES